MPTPRRASPWRLAALVALAALVCSVARAQEELQLDDAGNTIAVSIVTDANGDPLQTLVLSTLTTDAPVAEETTTTTTADVADPVADDTPTETTTLPTTTAAATTTEAGPVDVGQPGNVLTPASRCTTAGCPVAPTTYTQGGVIVTWYATTPATPQPQVTSSGVILGVGSYISSVSTATGGSGSGATAGAASNARSGAASARFSLSGGDWALMSGVALVGGLVGAVAVL